MKLLQNCNLPFRKVKADEHLYDDQNIYANDIVDAEYEQNEGYEDNPDVCALPSLYTDVELTRRFSPPDHRYNREDVQKMSTYGKLKSAYEIQRVTLPMSHLFELASTVDKVLRISYMSRQCKISERDDPFGSLFGGVLSINADVFGRSEFFLMKGLTGVGKSVAVSQVMSLYPKAVRHVVNGYEYTQIMILCATGQVGNLKALILSYAERLDEILDTKDYHTMKIMNKDLGKQCEILKTWIKRYHIGLLIVDEIQYMNFGNKDNSFERFVTISEETGCAIGMIGNREIDNKIANFSRIASRTYPNEIDVSVNSTTSRLYFESAVEKLWKYQYTDEKTELNAKIKTQLIMDSMYNISLLKNLIMMVQVDAIQSGTKKITPEFIHKTADKYFPTLQTLLMKDTPESEREVLNIFEGEKQKIANEIKKEEAKARQALLEENDESGILPENQAKFDYVCLAISSSDNVKYSEDHVRYVIDLCVRNDKMLQFKDAKDIYCAVKDRLDGKKPKNTKKTTKDNILSKEDEDAVRNARISA